MMRTTELVSEGSSGRADWKRHASTSEVRGRRAMGVVVSIEAAEMVVEEEGEEGVETMEALYALRSDWIG